MAVALAMSVMQVGQSQAFTAPAISEDSLIRFQVMWQHL